MNADKWKVISIIQGYPLPTVYGIFRGPKVFGATPLAILDNQEQAEALVWAHNATIHNMTTI